MLDSHAARPRLVVDNSRCIALRLRETRKKLKGDFGVPSRSSHLNQRPPEAGRNTIPRPHGADMAVASPDIVAKGPGRGPSINYFLKGLHDGATIQIVANLVNTKRSEPFNTMCSVAEETPATRLKSYRLLARHETAESFARRHAGIAGPTQRAREGGTRRITVQAAEKYAKIFKHYKATRHVTASLLLHGDPKNQNDDESPIDDSIRADYDALLDPLTEDELQKIWPSVVESVKLVKKPNEPKKARRSSRQ